MEELLGSTGARSRPFAGRLWTTGNFFPVGNGLINFSERSEQCPPVGSRLTKLSERGEPFLPYGRKTNKTQRTEWACLPFGQRTNRIQRALRACPPCGRIDKISDEQRKLKEWGFFTSLLFLYGRPYSHPYDRYFRVRTWHDLENML